MPPDRYPEVIIQLNRIEDKLDRRLMGVEARVDGLESIEDKRKGALRVVLIAWGLITGICGFVGANLSKWLS